MRRRFKKREVRFYHPKRRWIWMIPLLTTVALVGLVLAFPHFLPVRRQGTEGRIVPGESSPPQPKPQPKPVHAPPVQESTTPSVPEDLAIPVLCYHDISDSPSFWAVTPEQFEEHLTALIGRGATFITMSEAVAMVLGSYLGPIPDRPVAVTIDDGFPSAYRNAYPLLQRLGVKATLFIYTNAIQATRGLTWEELKEMAHSGLVEIGSHSVSHAYPFLLRRRLSRSSFQGRLLWEATHSMELIRLNTGLTVTGFAYPGGQVDETLKEIVRKAGYQWAVSINPSPLTPKSDRYEIPRFAVAKRTSLRSLLKWTEGQWPHKRRQRSSVASVNRVHSTRQ